MDDGIIHWPNASTIFLIWLIFIGPHEQRVDLGQNAESPPAHCHAAWVTITLMRQFIWLPERLGVDRGNLATLKQMSARSGSHCHYRVFVILAFVCSFPAEALSCQRLKYLGHSFNWFWTNLHESSGKILRLLQARTKIKNFPTVAEDQ